ncbi:MAG TPA: hypothetical protein VF069_16175 [Streptosporangiaceae bacterium]
MRSDGEADPTRHPAGALAFAWDAPLRDECWAALPAGIRTRLMEYAGEIIDWWARGDRQPGADGGPSTRPFANPSAAVLGRSGLSVAAPTPAGEDPGRAVSAYLLDPDSMRTRSIEHRPDPAADDPRAPASAAPVPQPVDIGLPDDARGVLGNLPPRAQAFLQGPFVTGQRVTDCGWHYEGDERRLDVFIAYLAGERDVAFVTGTQIIPPGHVAATAHWDLACYRATVIGRRTG